MITVCFINENPARDIVEGRTILPTVATVPYRERRAQRAVVREFYEDLPPTYMGNVKSAHGKSHSAVKLRDLIPRFRRSALGKGNFVAGECLTWCQKHGYTCEAIWNICTILRQLESAGQVSRVGKRREHGRRHSVVWRFTTTAAT